MRHDCLGRPGHAVIDCRGIFGLRLRTRQRSRMTDRNKNDAPHPTELAHRRSTAELAAADTNLAFNEGRLDA
eukprot:15451753-Alexandrium_andersonii.AAC.1